MPVSGEGSKRPRIFRPSFLTRHVMAREAPYTVCGAYGRFVVDLWLVDCEKCLAKIDAELAAVNGWDDFKEVPGFSGIV